MRKIAEIETEDFEIKPAKVFAFMATELSNMPDKEEIPWEHLFHDCFHLPGSLSKRWDKGFYWVISPSGTYMASSESEAKEIQAENKACRTYLFKLNDEQLEIFMENK